MTSFWAEHAWLPSGLARNVRLRVADGRFTAVECRTTPTSTDQRLGGVLLPGLANAHSHVFQRAVRGRTHGLVDVHAWDRIAYAAAAQLTPDTYLALARAVYAEMALAGYTVVGEYHYVHHGPTGRRYTDPNAMGAALVQAAADVGIRLTLLDVCRLHGGLTAEGHLPATGVLAQFSDGTVQDWADRMEGIGQTELLRRGAAIHSVRTVSRQEISEVAAAAGDRPLHVYVSEHPAENLACQMFYGCTPAALLAQAGALGPETTAVHASHLSGPDIALLAEHRSQAVVCPSAERDLGLGLGPVLPLLSAGVPVGIGSDSHTIIDPFVEMREIEMHERVFAGERARLSTPTLLRCASAHGYASLGWYGSGEIAPGQLADFVVVDPESPRTAGSKAAQIMYAATAADIRTVVVGGEPIVQDGEHKFGPVGPLLREALQLVRSRAVPA